MTDGSLARVFCDSGVFMRAIRGEWGAAKAILILGGHQVFALETCEVVMREVTGALARAGIRTGAGSDFARLCRAIKITVHPAPSRTEIESGLRLYLPLMRHVADVPVIVSACAVRPDWVVSSNTCHFNPAVARATGLRIVTPAELMRYLSIRRVP